MKFKYVQKFDLLFFIAILVMILFLVWSARAQNIEKHTPENFALTAGTLTLEKSVVAGGGNKTAAQAISEAGTSGQSIAGHKSNGGSFTLYSGFWTPEFVLPTAASVTVGGRVKTSDGRGIKNVIITITFPSGEVRSVITGAFGYYRFTDIPAGETYIFSVTAKRYSFTHQTQLRNVVGDEQTIDFIAEAPLSGVNKIAQQ